MLDEGSKKLVDCVVKEDDILEEKVTSKREHDEVESFLLMSNRN